MLEKSENIDKISAALVVAQSQMRAALKDAKNPFFKSTYATLEEVIEVIKKPLNDNGISCLQLLTETQDGKSAIQTMLLHSSGQYISSTTKIIIGKENDVQALGSAITYFKRYALKALCLIADTDDDGEGAMARPTQGKSSLLDEVRKFTKGKDQATINKMILFAGGDLTDTIETLTIAQLEKIIKHIRR